VNFLRRVVKHSAMLFLTTHGFSTTAEPAALARTAYHVLTAWIAVTAGRASASARMLCSSLLRLVTSCRVTAWRVLSAIGLSRTSRFAIRCLPAFIQPFILQPAPQRSRKRPRL
jgi:hypothetical protein